MLKESKTEYFNFRLSPSMKANLYKRADECGKDPSTYLTSLLEKDIAGYDLTDSEKPRMEDFSRKVALELFNRLSEHFDKAYVKTKNREEKLYALMMLQYRQSLYKFLSIENRQEVSGKLSEEQLENCEKISREKVNDLFVRFMEFVSSNDAERLLSYLQTQV
ncbi:MAG: hypothetical protein JXB48_22810 [Candidatus Latescibacteria bacterium]|nr:hypothetical protein [Candidatus Latescibacterota bacterium]